MRYRFACDCHNHSNCSFDGHSAMEELCEKAVELGLVYYGVSDHCECQEYEASPGHETGYRQVVRKAWDQMTACREKFPSLRLLRGIELGQPMQDLSAAEDALQGRDYDFVIGSLHNVAREKDFYHMNWGDASPERWEALFSRYFQEILDMIRWGKFHTLAHITYPLRYLSAPGQTPTFDRHQEELDAVLRALIQKDIALEMNTSRLGKKNAPHLPDPEVFRRYRELGGKLVTLGSDAHRAEDLAQGIELGMDLLKEAGFTEFAVFEKRKPVLLPLE